MSPEALQLAVLVVTGAAAGLVPVLILLLASRIRTAAHESTNAALSIALRRHEQSLAEFTRQYDRSLADSKERHDRAIAEYARQHERALAELAAEHRRIAGEFGMFSRKRHEVYARLYARYRRAVHDLTALLTGPEPDFKKFSRDDLLGYLKRREIRERDAADAISSMDRGDIFAMQKLMLRLHWRVTLRDANATFARAREFESLNELYLSEAVRNAVSTLRHKVDAFLVSMTHEDRSDQAARVAKQQELRTATLDVLNIMREDLSVGTGDRARPRELDRASRPALSPRTGLADRAAPTAPEDR